MAEKFVSYVRVSTARQGASGLGLDAQRAAVAAYVGSQPIAAEFCEVESGGNDDRPQLAAALAACRVFGARLVIAKLDRLSRDAHFLLGLQKAGVAFVAADMPEANEMVVGIMAVVAQAERKMISKRTKEALKAARARGTRLGGNRGNLTAEIRDRGRQAAIATRKAAAAQRATDLAPLVRTLQSDGIVSLRALARGLNDKGVTSPLGGCWAAEQVRALLKLMPA